jgi:hypothetical protein
VFAAAGDGRWEFVQRVPRNGEANFRIQGSLTTRRDLHLLMDGILVADNTLESEGEAYEVGDAPST